MRLRNDHPRRRFNVAAPGDGRTPTEVPFAPRRLFKQALRLAQRVEVAYTESGYLATNLSRRRNAADGQLDTVSVLRKKNKADLACLIVHTGTAAAGIAYPWTSGSSASAFVSWGYSAVFEAGS